MTNTVVCPDCHGTKTLSMPIVTRAMPTVSSPLDFDLSMCDRCHGTGRVPAPAEKRIMQGWKPGWICGKHGKAHEQDCGYSMFKPPAPTTTEQEGEHTADCTDEDRLDMHTSCIDMAAPPAGTSGDEALERLNELFPVNWTDKGLSREAVFAEIRTLVAQATAEARREVLEELLAIPRGTHNSERWLRGEIKIRLEAEPQPHKKEDTNNAI